MQAVEKLWYFCLENMIIANAFQRSSMLIIWVCWGVCRKVEGKAVGGVASSVVAPRVLDIFINKQHNIVE